MSNTKRPALARKVTPKDEKSREAAMDARVDIRIGDTVYSLVLADLTGLAEMKIRRETGMSVSEITEKLHSSPGVDLLGCFMYACEIGAGRDADLEAILGSISYATEVDVVDADEADPVPQP